VTVAFARARYHRDASTSAECHAPRPIAARRRRSRPADPDRRRVHRWTPIAKCC